MAYLVKVWLGKGGLKLGLHYQELPSIQGIGNWFARGVSDDSVVSFGGLSRGPLIKFFQRFEVKRLMCRRFCIARYRHVESVVRLQ